jgi:hypothetical protein
VDTSTKCQRFTEVFLAWQRGYQRVSASRSARPASWEPASLLLQAAERLDQHARAKIEAAVKASDEALRPLRDPLNLHLGAHRWLSADREESYSDWLAWILQDMEGAAEIFYILAPQYAATDDLVGAPDTVGREGRSEYGRTDVEVRFGRRMLILIEVKVQPTTDDLRSQLERYARWADGQETERNVLVLVAPEEPGIPLGKFEFTSWRSVCQRLRKYAAGLRNSDLLRSAAILVFCGAVEQNILGFSVEPKRFRAAATLDYLLEWKDDA